VTPADVGVIIPTLNEAININQAIRSADGAGEIIVVDGGSIDSTLSIAQACPHVRILTTAAGRGTQLCEGARICESPVLLFLHADCRLAAGVLEQVCRALEEAPQRGWGAMRQRIDAPQQRYRAMEWGNAMRVRCRGVPFGDQAIFVRRQWYQQVGGFEAIPLMEDLRLSLRLRRRSWPLLIDGPVIVSHRRWQRRGLARQTLLNFALQFAHAAGVSPQRLSRLYR
jgi:rSAM/selenodomain-associated transferase 2